ncbi:hypothetical protein E2C01_102520 [Portunus trituberculatus]|uniref:Secreted protein n=1 Tax=Portunus trituberculatus TaxID=210409 RepID=A0A5B7KIN0_PORTR|nr:hypothetical protein [Portunus trituberculatus]
MQVWTLSMEVRVALLLLLLTSTNVRAPPPPPSEQGKIDGFPSSSFFSSSSSSSSFFSSSSSSSISLQRQLGVPGCYCRKMSRRPGVKQSGVIYEAEVIRCVPL